MRRFHATQLWALIIPLVGCSSNDGTPSQVGQGGASWTNSPAGGSAEPANVSTGGGSTTAVSAATGGAVSGTSPAGSGGNPASGAATGGNSSTATLATGGTESGSGAATGGSTTGTATGGAATGGATTSTSPKGPAPGCGKSGAATGTQNLTLPIAGAERSYVLSVPASYDANKALPLIFAWHGLDGSGTMAQRYFGIERAANNQAILVYPTGLPNADGQAAWTLTQDGVDVQFFDTLLADISSNYCVDLARVFSTGHSYGAMMTNALGCFRSDVLRGVAPVAGMPPFGRTTCAGAVAAWIAHGDNDSVVDFTSGGIASRDFWLKLNGCATESEPVAVEPSPCVAYQDCSAGHPVHWCVHQNDHNWPSFAASGIWGFFDSLK